MKVKMLMILVLKLIQTQTITNPRAKYQESMLLLRQDAKKVKKRKRKSLLSMEL